MVKVTKHGLVVVSGKKAPEIDGELHEVYGIPVSLVDEYTTRTNEHIGFVQEAGRQLGVPDEQLEIHDASKLTMPELPAAAMFHCGGKQWPNRYSVAWLHHIHNNPHHWQYWIYADGFTPKGTEIVNGVLPMPENFALEMVADWMGSEMTHTGDWDMTKWLSKNISKMRIHPNTATFLKGVLSDLGYSEIVSSMDFAE